MLYCCMTHVVGHVEEAVTEVILKSSNNLIVCICASTVFVIFCDRYTPVTKLAWLQASSRSMKSISRSLSGICSTFKPPGMPNESTHDLWCIYRSVSTTRYEELAIFGNISSIAKYHKYEDTHVTGSAWYLQLTSSRLYLLCRIRMWEHTVITWWLRRGSSVQSSLCQSPKMKSKMTLSSQTPVAKYILLWFIIICEGQWFQSNAGSSYTCTLPNKTDTPRTSMQNFNGLQQFRNHFLLFSGIMPCWLQINLRLRILSWKQLTHHFEQISWNSIRNATS